MASIYDAVAKRSLAVIRKKGADVDFTGVATGAVYDPLTDSWSGGAASSETGSAVQVPGDPDRFAALKLVLVDPVTLLVAAKDLTVVPAPGGAFTWAGVSYSIKDCEPVAPDGTPILYTVTGSR